jgi:5-methylcytosine-specific restriction endonuclease McrA
MNLKELHQEQLSDVRWLKKRQKILARDMFLCTKCHKDKKLEVHHLYYVIDHTAWQYPDKALIVLCRRCHQKWHNKYQVEYRKKIWCKRKEYQPITKVKKRALYIKKKKVCFAEQQGTTVKYKKRKEEGE